MRVRFLLPSLLVAWLAAPLPPLDAQQGGTETPPAAAPPPTADADRKRQFLKAREEMHTVPATPPPSPTAPPRPKPRPRTTPVPEPATPRPRSTPAPEPATPPPATPRPVLPRPVPEVTPRPRVVTPFPVTFATPIPATPLPAVTPAPAPAPAPITIQKSGVEEDRGLEPATGGGGGGWFSFTKWKYLSASVRDAIDRAPVQKRRWRYIVIHNSGTRQGNAKAFDYYHLRVRKMRNGLAYHFVVGNGTSSGDGQIEIGNRWHRQINGGHVHSDYLNNIALGICLVGDFNRTQPTARQIAATEELVRYLRTRVGKIDRQVAILKAHREINPPRWPTDCPGDRFSNSDVHRLLDH